MKISDIKVTITEKDLFSIVTDVFKEYVQVPGLEFEKILIDKNLEIHGVYKNKITVPFSVEISLGEVKNNGLTLTIEKINLKKIKIFKGVIKVALKALSGKVKDLGIKFDGDNIHIDFFTLCKVIKVVNFELEKLNVIPYGLEAELKNFSFNGAEQDKKEENKDNKEESKEENKDAKEVDNDNSSEEAKSETKKVHLSKDYTYRKFRVEFGNKFSEKYKKIYPLVVLVPDIIALLTRLYKDPRVTKETKANISIALGYLVFPLDIIPDSIPVLGKLDDVAVVLYVIQKILVDIPKEVVLENWEGEGNIIEISSDAMRFLGNKFGTEEIKKVIDIVRISTTKAIKFFVD